MGCSDSFAIPIQPAYNRQVVYYQQPYITNQNLVYQQYPQNNVNYTNTPNNPINNADYVNQNYNANQVSKPEPKEEPKPVKKTKKEIVVKNTDDFEEKDYIPIFKSDLFDNDVQTIITKVYSDLRNDTDDLSYAGKINHIYVTLNYGKNCIDIIEIERSLSTEYKKHLKVTKIENECSMETAKPFLEKYNDEYGVDSTQWYKKSKFTNIYVKSEIDYSDNINMFEIFYDKSNSNLVFNKKQTEINFTSNGTPFTANPSVLVQNYNLLKFDFII
jgi:hypothetical protein